VSTLSEIARDFSSTTLLEGCVQKLVQQHSIACEELTERQMADAIKQAIMAGDFQKVVRARDGGQQVLYMPYHGLEGLRSENQRLKKLLHDHGISHIENDEREWIDATSAT
jgi:hypothetical protein